MSRPLFYPHNTRIAVLTQEIVGVLDYLAPEGGVRLGQLVVVPLGPRRVMGAVWGPGTGIWGPGTGSRDLGRGLGCPGRDLGTQDGDLGTQDGLWGARDGGVGAQGPSRAVR